MFERYWPRKPSEALCCFSQHLKEQNEDLSTRLTAQHNSFLSSLSQSSGGEQQQSLECPLWYSVIDKEDIAASPQLVSVLQEEARSRHQPEGAMQRQLSLKEELTALAPEVVMISREIQCEMLQATNAQQERCIL
uniref:Uncharacterized protein n=1 Tax=Timema poppense TaxID=170557 RepID=A0A7R9HI98_TIMPO|nr:unnamed protein product [Timema poppensis]